MGYIGQKTLESIQTYVKSGHIGSWLNILSSSLSGGSNSETSYATFYGNDNFCINFNLMNIDEFRILLQKKITLSILLQQNWYKFCMGSVQYLQERVCNKVSADVFIFSWWTSGRSLDHYNYSSLLVVNDGVIKGKDILMYFYIICAPFNKHASDIDAWCNNKRKLDGMSPNTHRNLYLLS